MVLIGFSDTLSLTQSIGIVGTMVLTLYFSKRHIQALSSDQETRLLNDLDDKFHNMAMLGMEYPSITRVIDTRDYANNNLLDKQLKHIIYRTGLDGFTEFEVRRCGHLYNVSCRNKKVSCRNS